MTDFTSRQSSTRDYLTEVAAGRVPGASSGFIVGLNRDVGATNSESVTDHGGNYTYLTANTQLYVSSSSASDTDVDITLVGLDEDYAPITLTANTNGQSQVALSAATAFRVYVVSVSGSTSPVGDLYIAETDTLTSGVPDTATKIKAKIPLTVDMAGAPMNTGTAYASDNISHLGLYTVPAGKRMAVYTIISSTEKNDNLRLTGRLRPFGGVWLSRNPVPVYQNNVKIRFEPPIMIPEKADLEFRALAGSAGGESQVQTFFVLEDL